MPRVERLVAADFLLHLAIGRRSPVAAQPAGGELGLQLREREDRRDRLAEAYEGEVIDPRLEHPLV
jgi:hypothetical protein